MISPFSFRLQFMVMGLFMFSFRDAAAQNQPSERLERLKR